MDKFILNCIGGYKLSFIKESIPLNSPKLGPYRSSSQKFTVLSGWDRGNY